MSNCEKCGQAPKPVGPLRLLQPHDYCAHCSKTLCPACMAAGHCGRVPAESGSKADENAACPECLRMVGHKKTCSRTGART